MEDEPLTRYLPRGHLLFIQMIERGHGPFCVHLRWNDKSTPTRCKLSWMLLELEVAGIGRGSPSREYKSDLIHKDPLDPYIDIVVLGRVKSNFVFRLIKFYSPHVFKLLNALAD